MAYCKCRTEREGEVEVNMPVGQLKQVEQERGLSEAGRQTP